MSARLPVSLPPSPRGFLLRAVAARPPLESLLQPCVPLLPAHRRQTKRRRPPSYRVLLHNDDHNKREYVVAVLLKVRGWVEDGSFYLLPGAGAGRGTAAGRWQRGGLWPPPPPPPPLPPIHTYPPAPHPTPHTPPSPHHQVVEGTTVDDAVNMMNEAHLNGLALVAECAQVRAALCALREGRERGEWAVRGLG